MKVYLDHSATTSMHEEVLEEMKPYFSEKYGNASSVHRWGQEARRALEESREVLASCIRADHREIYFTSGGTESDNLALKGCVYANRNKGNHVISSKIEHHAVLNCCKSLEEEGFVFSLVSPDKTGMVKADAVREAITSKTILVSIMMANNEIGTISPIKEIAVLAKERGILFHTDAVQAFGRVPVDVNKLGIDLMAISSHKIYGPKGVGALYIRMGTRVEPILHGGHHERSKRAGTENVPGIVGFARAAQLAVEEREKEMRRLSALRDRLEEGIKGKISDVHVNGNIGSRLPHLTNISFKYIEGEGILLNLDLEGVAVSTGSACTSGTLEPSHVLMATDVPVEMSQGSVRFSLGRSNTEEQIDYVLEILPGIIERLRSMSPLYRESPLRDQAESRESGKI